MEATTTMQVIEQLVGFTYTQMFVYTVFPALIFGVFVRSLRNDPV